jgi:hypothetical protein
VLLFAASAGDWRPSNYIEFGALVLNETLIYYIPNRSDTIYDMELPKENGKWLKANTAILLSAVFLLSSCGAILTDTGTAATTGGANVTLAQGTADGSSGSAPASASDTSVTITPSSGSAWNSFLVDLGSHFLAANICSGKTIFGRLGAAACMSLIDNRYNDVGTPETKRKTPRITGVIDDDGIFSSAVVDVNRTTGFNGASAWGANTCGITSGDSIQDRIDECALASKFGASATWDGATKSNVSHGRFVLVSRAASSKEVWRDERTGLLWSSRVGATIYNWCRAAGVGGVNDPNDVCDQGGVQDQTTPQSVCAEGINSDGLTLQSFVAGEDWLAGTYDNGKGKLGAHADAGGVQWRLPSREEYLQSYTNGIGFVIPDLVGGGNYWLSSVYSNGTGGAWYFTASANGYVNIYADYRGFSREVRCVGQ